MRSIRKIDGQTYIMRDPRPTRQLRVLWQAFCEKYHSSMTFHHWLVERGKVYKRIRRMTT